MKYILCKKRYSYNATTVWISSMSALVSCLNFVTLTHYQIARLTKASSFGTSNARTRQGEKKCIMSLWLWHSKPTHILDQHMVTNVWSISCFAKQKIQTYAQRSIDWNKFHPCMIILEINKKLEKNLISLQITKNIFQ